MNWEDVYLYLWFLFYSVRKCKESLQGVWSCKKWTKQSSSDAVIPLKASLRFQSCCTCKNKTIQYCSLPLLCFQRGVIWGWSLKQRFPNSKPGTYSSNSQKWSLQNKVTQSGLNEQWLNFNQSEMLITPKDPLSFREWQCESKIKRTSSCHKKSVSSRSCTLSRFLWLIGSRCCISLALSFIRPFLNEDF